MPFLKIATNLVYIVRFAKFFKEKPVSKFFIDSALGFSNYIEANAKDLNEK